MESSALTYVPVTADPYEAYEEALEEISSCKEDLDDAEEEYREAKQRLETAKQSLIDAEANIRQLVEENMDALLAKPTPWNEKYHRLKAFKEEHGHCNARRNAKNNEGKIYNVTPEERAMGAFVYANRKEARNDEDGLELYKKIALDQIGFDWDPFDSIWKGKYEELKQFKEERGHMVVPPDTKELEALQRWVTKMRIVRRIQQRGETPKKPFNIRLDAERIRMLDALGFVWNPAEEASKKKEERKAAKKAEKKKDRPKNSWDAKFALLEQYCKIHGHTVPGDECIKHLRSWTDKQREEAIKAWGEGKDSELTVDQLFHLRNINFIYKKEDLVWIKWYRRLQAYKILFGTTEVAKKLDGDQRKRIEILRKWRATQQVALERWANAGEMCLREDFLKLFENTIGRPARARAAPAEPDTQKKRKAQLPSDASACSAEKRQRLKDESLAAAARGPMYPPSMPPAHFYPFPYAYPHPQQMYMYPPPPPPAQLQQMHAATSAPPPNGASSSGGDAKMAAASAKQSTVLGDKASKSDRDSDDGSLEAAEI